MNQASSADNTFFVPRPRERFDHVGGISPVLDALRELVEWPLSQRTLYNRLGVDPPRGILLHGPPGCGKTLLANAVAGELGVPFFRLSAPEVVSGLSGESERKLRLVFSEAVRLQPSIIFIDEIDAIASSRDGASKEMERRIVSQLLSCIDALSSSKPNLNLITSAPSASVTGAPTGEANNSDNPNGDLDNCNSSEPCGDELDHANRVEDSNQSLPAVVVIAATNRPESLEPALRRAGRFDKEIELGAPDEDGRKAILQKLCRNLRLDNSFDVDILAKRTAGYVGADLHLLIKEAGLACIRRLVKEQKSLVNENGYDVDMLDECKAGDMQAEEDEILLQESNHSADISDDESGRETENEPDAHNDRSQKNKLELSSVPEDTECSISMSDFEDGLQRTQPSALREGFATRPNVSWENIGSLESVREEMIMAIVEPIRRPEMFLSLGLHAAGGVLLYGPPGCGKTLLARAVASESGANFISVKGPELLSKYVGDSELAVRKLFARARCSAPCIIFFDELDALAPRRGGGGDSSGASERVVNMLLTEMDGFNERKQVFLIAATNRPDIIDPAMLRPGRLDKLVFVPLPDQEGRGSILKTLLKTVRISEDVCIESIVGDNRCEGFSGADLQALIRVSGEMALKEVLFDKDKNKKSAKDAIQIEGRHFESALNVVMPSVSSKDAKSYRSMENWLRKSRGHVRSEDGANAARDP